jgi:hypothetical protein
MGINPPATIKGLTEAYDDLITTGGDLLQAAGSIAPAGVKQLVCQAGGLSSLLGGPLGKNMPPGHQLRLAADMGGLMQGLCPVPPPPPRFLPEVTPSIVEGGQCQDTIYIVTVFYKKNTPGATEFNVGGGGNALFDGPIEGATIVLNNNPPGSGAILLNHNGKTTAIASQAGGGQFDDSTITRITVRLPNGGPDLCGDRPPTINPPPPISPIPQLPESPIIPPATPDPSIPGGGGFIFRPVVGPITVNVNGQLIVPVVVNVGGPSLTVPITIPVDVSLPDFSPTINLGGDGGYAPPGSPPADKPPIPPEKICCRPRPRKGPEKEGEEGEEVEDDEPQFRERLVGVIVNSTFNGAAIPVTEVGQGSANRNLFLPRLGNLYFDVAVGTGAETVGGATVDAPIKLASQYVPCPPDVTVVRYRAVPIGGVRMRVSPVFVLAPAE